MELEDGSVLMYIRADGNTQWYASSRDGGEHWGDIREAPFVGPLSPATMFRLRDGRLLLVWNDHSEWTDIDRQPKFDIAPLKAMFSRVPQWAE